MIRTGGNRAGIGKLVRVIRPETIELTEQYLDWQADRFLFYEVHGLLGISFARFLDDPERYTRQAILKARLVLGGTEAAYA